MRKIESIKIENFEDLKFEIFNNYKTLSNILPLNNGPVNIKIYNILNTNTGLPELEKVKKYLINKFDINHFELAVYGPFSGTGFHRDNGIRHILPIISDDKSYNFEMDDDLPSIKEHYYSDKLYNGKPMGYTLEDIQPTLNEWFFNESEKNKLYIIPENECWEIGENKHAHVNCSFDHRIIIVFDTTNKI